MLMHDFQFGDIIENGWASDDNPTKRGVFLYYKVRTGRLNPGKHAVLRSAGGSLGEFRVDGDAKLSKVGTIFDERNAEIARIKEAIIKPYATIFLDGRNEHGSFVHASYPRGFEPDVGDLDEQAEAIIQEAEKLGFSVGEHVWAEFVFVEAQRGEFGLVEFAEYWEFKGIDVELSKSVNTSYAMSEPAP
jgi:hypothetical protein